MPLRFILAIDPAFLTDGGDTVLAVRITVDGVQSPLPRGATSDSTTRTLATTLRYLKMNGTRFRCAPAQFEQKKLDEC